MTNPNQQKMDYGVDVVDNIKDPIKKTPAILGEWLRRAELHMLYAPRGAGKTYISMLFATALASGNNLFNWQNTGKYKVLYFDGEMGQNNTLRRFREIELNNHFKDATQSGNLTCCCYDNFPETVMLNLSARHDQAKYNHIIKHYKPDVIFFDNLNTCSGALDNKDNDFEVWKRIQKYILMLKSKGITVFLIHHAGKSGLQLGTIQRENIMDSIIKLSHSQIKKDDYPTNIELEFEKERHFSKFDAPSLLVSFNIKKDFDGDSIFKFDYSELSDARIEYISLLSAQGFNDRQIKEHLNISSFTFQKLKNQSSIILHNEEEIRDDIF